MLIITIIIMTCIQYMFWLRPVDKKTATGLQSWFVAPLVAKVPTLGNAAHVLLKFVHALWLHHQH